MRGRVLLTVITFTLISLAILVGCGANAAPAATPAPKATPTPTPPAPTPPAPTPPAPTPPTPTPPTPTPPAPTPPAGGSSGSTQWSSSVVWYSRGGGKLVGTVTVSTAGDVSVNVNGAEPSTTFDAFFCQYPGALLPQGGCTSLNQSLVTDSTGKAQLTFHFPKSGPWAGAFYFYPGGDLNSTDRITTDMDASMAAVSAPFVPTNKVNNATGGNYSTNPSAPQDPGSGSVTVNQGTLTVNLKGAPPNTEFFVHMCFSDGSSACQNPGNFTTDASGNATEKYSGITGTGTIVELNRMDTNAVHNDFVSGFTVP